MITKRTTELRAGDRVQTKYGTRTVSGTEEHKNILTDGNLIRVGYVREPTRPYAEYAYPDEEWSVEAPSKLEEAVQRAQELADWYDQYGADIPFKATALSDFAKLLAQFREAR